MGIGNWELRIGNWELGIGNWGESGSRQEAGGRRLLDLRPSTFDFPCY
ncbi:MAG: hypothetical protein F6K47_01655 [Symploca sp. SIO2E6]|nr:hypothetical protein [Symploca sp. SIO2E6]